MESNMTFRINTQVKAEMAEICKSLGMTPSTAFNIFANAFVREKGMPFPVTMPKQYEMVESAKAVKDAENILDAFGDDYRRMAE